MIRTLLVDDEPIVRKGLLHILPWGRHGMQVVADVGGGEQALRVLEQERIDLLVTDLTMPGMSGFELIHKVQQAYPSINIAILTCHQDFQYIQEALRRGVLDYIVKTELDEEKLDELFQRMAARLALKETKAADAGKAAPGGREIVLFIGLESGCVPNELYKVPHVAEHFIIPIGSGSWMVEVPPLPAEWDDEARLALQSNAGERRWLVVRLHHAPVRNQSKEAAYRYMRRHVFYVADLGNGAEVVHDSLRDMKAFENADREQDWLRHWSSFEWIFDLTAWEELIKRIQEQRPDPGSLCRELADMARAWHLAQRHEGTAPLMERMASLRTWPQWKEWLAQYRGQMAAALESDDTGKELAVSMLKAIRFCQQRMEDNLTQKELSSLVHLSRGYFSESFKRIVGLTYNDYMRRLRVDTARRLLTTTDLDITEIAKRCGFEDETYFRRLFREETGMSVKDYREQGSRDGYALNYLGADGRQMSEPG